jgi:hypothetical protein
MECFAPPYPPLSYPPLTLASVIWAVRAQVGNWGAQKLLGVALAMLTYRRLGQISQRMERLMARFQAGRLWRRPARAVVADMAVVEATGAPRARAEAVLPVRFGWLVRAAAWRAAVYGGQLRIVLQTPEMVALLTAAPQAARILRPLCRMLLVETSLLRPGMPEVVRPARVLKARVRRPRAKVDWGRIPLPRGMMAAAKRQGFGKVPRD